jgi:hypothetical protein
MVFRSEEQISMNPLIQWIGFFCEYFIICILFFASTIKIRATMFYDQIKPNHKTEFEQLLEKLPKATTYAEWLNIAQELDTLRNMDQWKNDMKSPLYDFKLIISRLNSFKAARIAGDTPAMKLLIRSGLLRNLGGICDSRLHTNTFTGTKKLIDEYLNEVVQTIDYLMENGTQTANEKMVIFRYLRLTQ